MDVKTLILMLALGNMTLSAALYFFDYGNKKSAAMATWLVAKQCQALAWLLFYFRSQIPDVLSNPLANALLFGGIALEAGAMWESADHHGWRRILLPMLGVCVGVFWGLYFTGAHDTLLAPVASLIIGVFFHATGGALLIGWASATMLRRFIATGTLLLASIIVLRGAGALLMPDSFGWMNNNGYQTLAFVGLYLLMLTNGFGFLLLSREKQDAELMRLAVIDPLTDAPNRRGFFNALTPWMSLARRPGQTTALIMLDLDHFKRVNDTYGHPVGDLVLKMVVEIGQKQLRDSDLIGRIGGEEFAVLLPRTALPEALIVAERMRLAMMAMPIKTERAMIYMTASFGVTTIAPEDSMVTLFKRADAALYAAKNLGRNRVMEATPAEPLVA
jgi:diguanylate cyclase (GGDEF)-like protein